MACGRFHNAASIWPVWLLSSSMPCLPSSTICGDSFSISLRKIARRGERLDRRVGLHEDRAVRAHGEAGAQLLLRVRRADADDDDFGGAAFLLDAQRLFERDLIEGIDAHLDAVGHDTRAVGFDADADVVVHDPFQAHQNLAHTRLRKGRIEGKWSAAGRRRATVREIGGGRSQTAAAGIVTQDSTERNPSGHRGATLDGQPTVRLCRHARRTRSALQVRRAGARHQHHRAAGVRRHAAAPASPTRWPASSFPTRRSAPTASSSR